MKYDYFIGISDPSQRLTDWNYEDSLSSEF